MRWKSLIGKVLVLLGATIFALLCAEGCMSFIHLPLQSAWRLTHTHKVVLDDDVIVMTPKFTHDKFYHRTKDRYLLVALGDSFTEGYPVARCEDPRVTCEKDDSWPGSLANNLSDRGVSIQVVNAGYSESGPDQHLRHFTDHILPRLKPDIVIWQFCANDLLDNYIFPTYSIENGELTPLSGRDNWLWKRQNFWNKLPLPQWVKSRSRVLQALTFVFQSNSRQQVPEQYKSDPRQWSIDKLEKEIAMMNHLAEEVGFQVYFVLIAPQSIYLRETDPERWDKFINMPDYSAMLSILSQQPNFELAYFETPELVAHGIQPTIAGPPGVSEMIFVDKRAALKLGFRHYNENGYRLVADRMADRLINDQVVYAP
ncbi:MAG: hypothetical protein HN348_01040 [Proteobacteria bacterium]|jgi:hypothetical protein|nr:hypothetical protein [Pseudomonadota bacterium]